MAESRVDVIFKGKDQLSKSVDSVQKSLGGLNKSVGVLQSALVGGIGGIAASAGFGAIASAIGNVTDAIQDAAKMEGLSYQFENMAQAAGQVPDALLAAMQETSRGMISNSDLILAANRSMLLGVADSADELQSLLKVAMSRGQAMGMTTAQAFNDLVTGLGRASPLILDNLGIVIDSESLYAEYAASVGKAADALTEAEKKQALVNKTMQEAQTITAPFEGTASAIERAAVAGENLKTAFGEAFAPAYADVAERLADALNRIGEFTTARSSMEEFQKALAEAERTASEGNWLQRQANAAHITELKERIAQSMRLIAVEEDYKSSIYGVQIAEKQAGDAAAEAGRKALTAGSDMTKAANDAAKAWAGLKDTIRSAFMNVAVDIGSTAAISGYKELQREAEAYRKVMQAQRLDQETVDVEVDIFVQKRLRALNDEIEATRKLTEATDGQTAAVSSMGSTYEDAFGDIRGRVSGLLTEALGGDIGVNPEDFLPRPDALNEDARRLADVMVNGFGSPWAAYFEREFPALFAEMTQGGDIQGAAAAMLQQFQQGLRPELVDREAVKERVKAMLVGEANMAALAQEITAELASELGGNAASIQEQVSKMLGVGFEGDTSAVDGMISQLTAPGFADQVAAAGEEAAGSYSAAFVDWLENNMNPAIVTLLTQLVTPQVAARLQADENNQKAKP